MDKDKYVSELRYLFVGEKRSKRAILLGVTWDDVALCSKTLHEALQAIGVYGSVRILNLWGDDGRLQHWTIKQIQGFVRRGYMVIGMGQKVQAILTQEGIAHIPMIHPAARGAIRKKEDYQAHVALCLEQARRGK